MPKISCLGFLFRKVGVFSSDDESLAELTGFLAESIASCKADVDNQPARDGTEGRSCAYE